MAAQVGAAFIAIRPNLSGFHRTITKELKSLGPQVEKIGLGLGRNLGDGIRKGIGDPISGPLDESTKKQRTKAPKQGDEVAGAFARGFQKRLQAAFAQLPQVKIDADSSEADKKIADLRARMQALGEKTIGVDIDAEAALAELETIRGELAGLGQDTPINVRADVAAALSQLEAVQAEVARINGETAEVHVDVDKDTVATIDRASASLVRLAAAGRGAGKALGKGLKFSVIGAGLITLAAGAASAAGEMVQFAAALAPVGGLVAGIPAAVGGAVVALGTLRLATTGVGDAFKAAMANDPKKFAESLQGLSPAARAVATELHALRPELLGIRNAAQQALFTPLRGQLTALVTTLAGPLRQGVRGVAAEFGAAGAQVAKFLTQAKSVNALRAAFAATAGSLRAMTPALQPVLAGFRDIAVAAFPTLQQLAPVVAQVATRFGQWMQTMAASGRVTTLINNGLMVLRQIGTVALNIGGILKSVFSAASSAGSGFLGVMGQALASLNQFLKSAAGQQALQSLFAGLAAIGRALSPVIQALVRGLGMLAAPIGRLAQQLGPVLVTAINAVAPALTKLEPGIKAIITALGQGIKAIAPVLAPVGQAISQIAVALAPVLPLIAQLIVSLVQALLPVVRALIPVVSLLVGAIAQILPAITPILPPLGQLIAQLITALMPVLTPLIGLVVQVARAFLSLLPILLPLVGLVVQLVIAFVPLLPPIIQLASLLISLLVPILQIAIKIFVQIVQILMTLLMPVIRLLVTVIKTAVTAISAAIHILGAVFHWLYDNVIKPVWTGIRTAISGAWGFIKGIFNGIVSFLRATLGAAFKWLYDNVIKPAWHGIGTAISTVWNSVIKPTFGALKSGVNAVKTAFSTAVSAIKTIWHGLESATKKPVEFVVNTVYNNGIRSVWNKVAGLVHLPALPAVKFAVGGIFPGYTPGRDPYAMPMAAFSGGEAVMRPEFTRAVGPDFVYAANKVARKRGVSGVRDWLANGDLRFARGGIIPGPIVQRFDVGGILGAIGRAGSLVIHGASSLLDKGASSFAKHALSPILAHIPGANSTWAKAIYSLPKRMIDGFIGWLKKTVDPKLGGDPLGVVAAAKKYVGIGDDRGPNNNIFTRAWGMPGAPWCAIFVSTAIKDAHAGKHYPGYPTAAVAGYNNRMRHVPVSAGRPGDLGVYGGGAHINIIERKVGSAYMTIGGNQNALVQRRVRGGQTSMLRPNYAMGGILGRQAARIFGWEAPRDADPHEMQTPLVQLMRSLPKGQMGSVARAIVRNRLAVTNAGVYDDGGMLQPGLNLAFNATRRPEPVLTGAQWEALATSHADGDTYTVYNVYPQRAEFTVRDLEALQRRQEALARVGRPV